MSLRRIVSRRLCRYHFFFFFFQAEDGIRDKLVTGVQTCALPISRLIVEQPQRDAAIVVRPCVTRLEGDRAVIARQGFGVTPETAQGNAAIEESFGARDRKSVV